MTVFTQKNEYNEKSGFLRAVCGPTVCVSETTADKWETSVRVCSSWLADRT